MSNVTNSDDLFISKAGAIRYAEEMITQGKAKDYAVSQAKVIRDKSEGECFAYGYTVKLYKKYISQSSDDKGANSTLV